LYTKQIPFKDFKGNPRNHTVHFNLTEREVFKLLKEFKQVFDWRESIQSTDIRELDTAEVIEFYNAFEEILLSAWGVPSEDGLHFRKSGRYEFEESALFNACMVLFVTEPEETGRLIDGIMPKGMEEMVKKADANLDALGKSEASESELRREIERLRSQLPAPAPSPATPQA